MHTHLITPHAPLVLRVGKPFGETGGGDCHPFPLPSTVAGALRTAHADALKLDFERERDAILKWAIHGVLPAQVSADVVQPLFPHPADGRYVQADAELALQRLRPAELLTGEGCDLADGLLPVFIDSSKKSKPAPGPAWWNHPSMTTWLMGDCPPAQQLGPKPLPVDARTHVALDPRTLAARSGQLFQSAGPDFGSPRKTSLNSGQRGWEDQYFGLLAHCSKPIAATLLRLGGESRLADIRPSTGWPAIPSELAAKLEGAKGIRLLLASPALFNDGWRPGWVGKDGIGSPPTSDGLKLRLRAAVLERWQPLSGWDLEAGKAKAVRRLVPAGAVYWFEVLEAPPDWAGKLWLSSLCDRPQDQCDGFGLSLPGFWY